MIASCGVRPTPVLTGGEAPTVSSHELTVYLVTAGRDGLVRRTRSHTGTVDTATAINLLVAGLTEEEKRLGLLTEVPASSSRVHAISNVIVLPEDMVGLSKLAQFQLYCTAVASRAQVEGVPATGFDCP
ncbi:hypothetical protein SAMN05216188_116103 [Lentzea xinjiangensis]|uniref:Uncharacterized protein n=1 Tax=Lentzea xinjiangensis TaxID=402600 RepID=A0A1H9SHZ6_9PSEU|nr:hypothetical protein [Lentzea xinjiangensis]SER84518.1 hypothetical protein SAMN05216188_116103 [Lentzea xinjiangensis]